MMDHIDTYLHCPTGIPERRYSALSDFIFVWKTSKKNLTALLTDCIYGCCAWLVTAWKDEQEDEYQTRSKMNFYFEAARTLDRLDAKEGSVKGVLATLPEKVRKRTSALVIETLKYKQTLLDVIKKARLVEQERKKLKSQNLALVLVHDLLLSGGIQAGDGPIKQAVLRHKTRLHGEFQRIKIKSGARENKDLTQVEEHRASQIPRYVRVNTILCTMNEAVKAFASRGFTFSDPFESSKGMAKDLHIPNLLLFHPQTSFHEDPLYGQGKIILQDKASCFPAVILDPPAENDSVVIDATAAPGNKTSHLSALMNNKGKLFAFERDNKRFNTLKMMLSKAGCKNTECINGDFLTTNPSDPRFARATHILLDPSCSGSGIVNRLDHLLETEQGEQDTEAEHERLKKLSSFQLLMIKHAMTFPSAVKIVYSTCSIHAIENEHVVREALRSEEARTGHFNLATQDEVLPSWPRRGLPEEIDDAKSLVRCSPGEDATNGFFVSCFVRASSSSRVNGGTSKLARKRKSGDSGLEVGESKTTKRLKLRV